MRRLILPISFGLIGIVILVSLGNWQVRRLAWKQEILAEIDGRIAAAPIEIPTDVSEENDRFLSVRGEGRILDEELHVLASSKQTGAIYRVISPFEKSDYKDAGVPMLNVTHGRKATRAHILVYTVLLAAVAIGMGFTSVGGPIYLLTAVVMNAGFLWGAFAIWRRDDEASSADDHKRERSFFRFSLMYLFLHFGAILAEVALAPYGLGGW